MLNAYFVNERRRSRPDWAYELHYRNEAVFREYDALTTLLKLYGDTGLYSRPRPASSLQGGGAIDWSRTLAKSEPIVFGSSAFYPELYRTRREALVNEVSLIQAVVTCWLARKYGMLPDVALADVAAGIDHRHFLAPRRVDAHIGAVRRERMVTYVARDLQLLDTLEAVLSGLDGLSGQASVRLHGTSAFAQVWEDALRDLFGDDSEHARMGHPIWHHLEGGSWSAPDPVSGHEIDLLVRRPGEVIVLDAKYHFPFPISRPGWADIVKQLYYGETIHRSPRDAVRNAFMLPMPGQRLRLAARVEVGDAERTFPPIEAWHVDPAWVFSSYGDGELARRARARDLLFAARDEVAEVLGYADGKVSG